MTKTSDLMTQHNRTVEPTSDPIVRPVESERICVLLSDGSLCGTFKSREDALYWTISQELKGFSTYDLRDPTTRMNEKS
jgi:hypothetical protein